VALPDRQTWQRIRHWAGPGLVLVVFSIALTLLYRELHKYHYHEIKESISNIPGWRLAACLGLTTLNYLLLIGYDLIAIRSIGHPLPLPKVALASFTGFVTSYNFGALLGGTPVRIRLYSSFGMSAAEIVRMMVAIGTTFWVGVFALAGSVFIVEPMPLPQPFHLAVSNARPIGVVMVVLALAYLCLPLFWKKPLRWREHELLIPRFSTLLAQLAVSAADLTVAAGSMYVILPESAAFSYWQFLGVYLLAIISVIMTHVPGGVGILELIILTFAAPDSKPQVLAALVAFRVIYYLLPLVLAFSMLLTYELRMHSEKAQAVARRMGGVLGGVTPMVVALGTMLVGAVLLFSGATPPLPDRLKFMHSILPPVLVGASHFLNSLVGGGLLLLARGLQRRLDAAWWGAVTLLGAGVVVSLGKGFDYEEAIIACLVLVALVCARKQFYRKGSILRPAWSSGWIAAVGIALLCTVWLGLFSHKHFGIDHPDQQWWQFLFNPAAPRFARALVGAAVLIVGFAVAHAFSARARVKTSPGSGEELEQAAQIAQRSPRTSSNLALLGDKILLFNDERTAFIMYGIQGRCWISMGDPVGPEEEWSELVWEFREQCDRYDAWPVFYQVDPARLTLYLDQGYSLLKLGEEARVDASQFTLEGGSRKGLRQNHNRFAKEGFSFEIVSRENVAGLLPTLKTISDEWLAEKQSSEKGFSLGYFDEAYLRRFPCAVVRANGEVLAFANVWLAAGNEELSIDLMRYRPGGPRGLMDYLFVELLLWGRSQGYHWFNLGMAPLSGIESRQLAPLWNKFAALLFRHGDRFYGFEGLREYKDKFDPVWTPKYLAARGGLALPRILADVTTLIGRKR